MFGLDALSPDDQDKIRFDIRRAIVGGGVAAALMLGVLVLVGLNHRGQARPIVEAAMPSVRFLASAVMTVSATTLALMLTLLGLSSNIDGTIRQGHFERVRQIALVDVCAFVLSTALLVVVVVPVGPESPLPSAWFGWIYYGVSTVSAVLGGGLVAVMLLLYAAIRDMIIVLSPSDDNPLLDDTADEEAADEEAADEDEEAVEDKGGASARS